MQRSLRTAGSRAGSRSGSLLIEMIVAAALFTVVMLSAMAMIESGRKFSASTLEATAVEDLAQQMLYRFERELANASGIEARADITGGNLTATETAELSVTKTLGFPPSGTLILDRGTNTEERVEYANLAPDKVRFQNLTRGIQCTTGQAHLF
jgi:type II secretory pathway component PulJ